MERNNEKVEKRISGRCLGKSKYIATAHGIWGHQNNNTDIHDDFLARLLLKLQIVTNKLADLVPHHFQLNHPIS